MRKRWTFGIVSAVGLLLALVLNLTQAQGPAPEEALPGQGFSLADPVDEKISYQGQLFQNGVPVDGGQMMVFRLYSDSSCSTLVDTIDAGSVQVVDGYFDVALGVNQADFNGQGLWLQVEVEGIGLGCEEIVPAPYALSLRPGATIQGAPGLTEALVSASSAGGEIEGSLVQGLVLGGAGVYGYSNSATGYGVYGAHTNDGYAGFFAGDVGQGQDDNGLVKAAVYATCGNSGSTVHRYFNNVNTYSITVANGATAGRCTIDFNFDIDERFWTATGYGLVAQGVSCQQGVSSDKLDCFRWSTAPSGVNGDIMVVVY